MHLYKRREISIWDYLANIAALGSALFNGLCKVFGILYSGNFDNYKTIESILSKESKKIKLLDSYKNVTNDFESPFNLEKNLIDEKLENNKLYKDENNLNDEDIGINDIDDVEENFDEDNKMINKLPKLRFFDFFFNNIYSKCCVYIKRQKLIDSCDEIIYNYYSVENMLYNQILFENLIKDYQWNNPELKSIHKNKFIIELKKYIN